MSLANPLWFQRFNAIWPLPDNYVAIDVETSGLSSREDYLCTFGFAVVVNRQIYQTGYCVLNWFLDPQLDVQAFRDDLNKVENAMREKGKNFFHDESYLRQHGIEPRAGLQLLHTTLQNAREAGYPLVGFNGYNFDANFIQAHVQDFLKLDYMIGDNELFDLGMMEKAAQLDVSDQPLPGVGETKREWAFRIGKLRRKGIMWALDTYCLPRYDLVRRFNLDRNLSHRSDYDSLCLHYLLEMQRTLAA